jgi:glycosyltransferase involved in cell wall biosynthesis
MLLCHTLGIGGSERQLTETAKALDPERFEAHVGAFHTEGLRAAELELGAIPVVEIPVRSFGNSSVVKGGIALRRYIRKHRIRLAHAFDVPASIFLSFTFPFRPRPLILASQRAHRHLAPGFHRKLVRGADHLVDGIVVNCEFIRRHLIEDERVPAELIDLCYNGVDTEHFSPGPPAEIPEPLRGGGPVVGAVCALRAEKDLPTLLRAFSILLRERPRSRLLILGSGPEEAALRHLANELGIASAALFSPATPDVVPWLRMLDVFVLSSLSEALSNALIEAMACGVCAVASKVGGNPELIGADERGWLFNVGNADQLGALLVRLADDSSSRHTKAATARGWILSNLAIGAAAKRMAQIYEKHLGAGSFS